MTPEHIARQHAIVEAWRRGWTLDQIGFACNISRERARQILEKYEIAHGPVPQQMEKRRSPGTHQGVKRAWICAHCGKSRWSKKDRFHNAGDFMFCSMLCYSLWKRIVSDSMVELAIDRRWQGKSWTSIAHEFDRTHQALQTNIWKYLYKIGLLNLETVESIWRPHARDLAGRKYRAAWRWLERNTGIVCTEDEPRLEKTRNGQTAWGRRIVREPVSRYDG